MHPPVVRQAVAGRGVRLCSPRLRRVELDDAGVRILLSGASGLRERVRDLAEREAACCSSFTFTIEGTDEALTLRVSVPQERRDLLGTLAARAQELSVTNGAWA